jgi:hypothetical protein
LKVFTSFTHGKGQGRCAEAPKRLRSGYILFTMDKRNDVKASNPGIANKEIMKKFAEEWKALSDKEKKVYNDRVQGEGKLRRPEALIRKEGQEGRQEGEEGGKEGPFIR